MDEQGLPGRVMPALEYMGGVVGNDADVFGIGGVRIALGKGLPDGLYRIVVKAERSAAATAGGVPNQWDEWALARARKLVTRTEEVNHPRAMLVSAIQCALVEAMEFAAQPHAQAEEARREADDLRIAVLGFTSMLRNGEWADFFSKDKDAAALEAEITNLVAAQRTAGEPVGEIVAADTVHGWHFKPYVDWYDIGNGTKLYTSAPSAASSDARDAARYRWLRDKSEPGICAFYLSVGQAFKGVRFTPKTVDEAIDAQIATMSAPAAGEAS